MYIYHNILLLILNLLCLLLYNFLSGKVITSVTDQGLTSLMHLQLIFTEVTKKGNFFLNFVIGLEVKIGKKSNSGIEVSKVFFWLFRYASQMWRIRMTWERNANPLAV